VIWILFLVIAAAAFAVGFVVGQRAGGAHARIQSLEEELRATQGRFDEYREHVEKHFEETAHLFHDLAHKHAALYQHLAEGARDLVGHPIALERGLGDPLIALGRGEATPTPAPAAGPAKPTTEPDE
jgi:uncharacterized protein